MIDDKVQFDLACTGIEFRRKSTRFQQLKPKLEEKKLIQLDMKLTGFF